MLSKRLNTILDMINDKDTLIDVGCDHALLDIAAVEAKKVRKAYAIDIKASALEYARKNIEKYKTNNITLLEQDGLKNIIVKDSDIVVISGLGTRSIKKILHNRTEIKNIIIQSNNDLYDLRKYMLKNYYIFDEKAVVEKDNYYVIMYFKKGYKKYSFDELLFGPFLLKNDKIYLNKLKENYTNTYINIPRKYFLKRYKYKLLIKIVEKNIKR
jgi:tRNA (adenine22-N1)-methyltransferase